MTTYPHRTLLFISLLSFSIPGMGQRPLQERTDSVAALAKKYLNEKDTDKMYELTGPSFRKAITKDVFRNATEQSLFPMGELKGLSLEKTEGGVFLYKGSFASGALTLGIGLEADDKISTFFFKQYIASRPNGVADIPSNNPMKSAQDLAVDSIARAYLGQGGTEGMSIGILKDGQTYYYGYGYADKEKKNIPSANTIFELGSISKTFTATIAALAIGEGKIKLDDPVNKYLPDSIPSLQYNNRAVTIRDLLNHTSAFPRMPADFQDGRVDERGIIIYPVDKFFSWLKNLKLTREPGQKSEYSNAGLALVSTVMQRLYNMSYEQLVQKFIGQPLGMADTKIDILKQDSVNYAKGYREDGSYHFPRNLPPIYQGAGGLRSTAADMLRYAKAEIDPPNKKLRKAMLLTRDTTFSDKNFHIGMVWMMVKYGNLDAIFHNGATGGFRSYLAIAPEKNLAVIVLVNSTVEADKTGATLMRWLSRN